MSRAEQRSFGWLLALAGIAALSLCAAVYFSGRERQFSYEAAILREQARAQTIELTRLNEAFAILYGADTTVVSFGEKQPRPKGKVFCNPALGFLLVASGLPPAPPGKAYEAWLIPQGGKAPVPAGMFQARNDGTAMHLDRRAMNLSATQAVAVTLEVTAGVEAPTSTPLIVAGLPPALQ